MHAPAPLSAALVALALALPGAAWAFPHVEVDASVDLRFDDAGRLTAVATTWTYDEVYTADAIAEFGMDRDGDGRLTAEERRLMARLHTEAAPDQEVFPSHLWLAAGDRLAPLELPSAATARLEGGRLTVAFERRLETPADPETGLVLRLFDPSDYMAYALVAPARADGLPPNCMIDSVPFEAGLLLADGAPRLTLASAAPSAGDAPASEVRVSCR